MIKKIFIIMILLLLIPNSYGVSNNPNINIEINLDNYKSVDDKFFYKEWFIYDKSIPTFGEFRLRFNNNIYYKDIESIVLLDEDQQIPLKVKINNASVDIKVLEPLRPNTTYKLIIYQYSKYKYSVNINTEDYGDIEPNNNSLEANSFILGDRIIGSIQKDNPDYFCFILEKPTEILFSLTRKDGEEISLTPFIINELENEYIQEDKYVDYTGKKILYKAYFNPGKYYFKVESNLDKASSYVLNTRYKIIAASIEIPSEDTFENPQEIFDNEEIYNTLNFYYADGNFDNEDIYSFYLDDHSKMTLKYDSNKKGNYISIYKYEEPNKFEVIEEYKNKADDFKDSINLEDGRYYIKIWNKAYNGVSYKFKINID